MTGWERLGIGGLGGRPALLASALPSTFPDGVAREGNGAWQVFLLTRRRTTWSRRRALDPKSEVYSRCTDEPTTVIERGRRLRQHPYTLPMLGGPFPPMPSPQEVLRRAGGSYSAWSYDGATA